MSKRLINTDANGAVATVAHALNDVIALYPITPSSTMGEIAEKLSADGVKNIFGNVPKVSQLQSEAGAAGATHGSLRAGALSTTFTASQGLLLMIPELYKIAGELIPAVFHVSARALAAHALSIFGDHQDVMACRQTGWAMLSSCNPQQAQDMALIAQAATLKSRVPFMHFFDGFRTSHEIQRIEELTHDDMKAVIDEEDVRRHRAHGLSPDHPYISGTAQNPDVYFAGRERANLMYTAVPGILEDVFKKFEKATGRRYSAIEYYGAKDAEYIVVAMGSSVDLIQECIDALNADGEKYGVINVRLYRPFPMEEFVKAIPSTTKKIAVLDRTKEPGSIAEPLCLDVRTAVGKGLEHGTLKLSVQWPTIIGGRYGLGSKDFTPAMVKAVFDNLKSSTPKDGFTVGINDDVSHTSLDIKSWSLPSEGVYTAKFFGLGSDGTVGANKNTAKIVGDYSDKYKYIQAYFVYDSKKAGSVTVSHLRFSNKPIKRPYLVANADFIACHDWEYLAQIEMFSSLKVGGSILINSPYKASEVWSHIPPFVQEQIKQRQARLYVIDAVSLAQQIGLGRRYNLILQTAYFKIQSQILSSFDDAVKRIKESAYKTYSKRGEKVVEMNYQAVDSAITGLEQVMYPGFSETVDTSKKPADMQFPDVGHAFHSKDPFTRDVLSKMIAGRGEELPVSALPLDGVFPTGTAKLEKRNIASQVPCWDPETCIQCGFCAFVCPHAAIRMQVYDKGLLSKAPSTFKHAEAKGKEFAGMAATIQVAVEDCTGCELCIHSCPAKNKSNPDLKAINMTAQRPIREEEIKNFDFFQTIPDLDTDKINTNSVKGSQLITPLFEFSGACAGCGETPYVKLLTQLFGDRLLIANATGCSSIYGGNLPTTPYTTKANGCGPAWANSLFEDNAEFGLGMHNAVEVFKADALRRLEGFKSQLGSLADEIINAKQNTQNEVDAQRARVAQVKEKLAKDSSADAKNLLNLIDYAVRKSTWILGGDGWAYDIGYGGVDHIMASGENVNILVLDTEVYSNTGGQASKSTPIGATAKFAASGKRTEKKSLGQIALTYSNVYVAYVSLTDFAQVVKAFNEAEAYNGVSVIVAYSHCIEHGMTSLAQGIEHQKIGVEAGHIKMFRYNPALIEEGKNPLTIDSKEPSQDISTFYDIENRFKQTYKAHNAEYINYLKHAQEHAKTYYARLKAFATTFETKN